MADEVAWLVEMQDPKNPGCVAGLFLGFAGTRGGRGHFEWFNSVQWAIRFARRDDAENFAHALIELSEELPHDKTLPGLRSGDLNPIAVEHSWSDPSGTIAHLRREKVRLAEQDFSRLSGATRDYAERDRDMAIARIERIEGGYSGAITAGVPDRALEGKPGGENTWRPISEAPEDGTVILATWIGEGWEPNSYECLKAEHLKHGGEIVWRSYSGEGWMGEDAPTHWQPLSPPPIHAKTEL